MKISAERTTTKLAALGGAALLALALGSCKKGPPISSAALPFTDDFERAELGTLWSITGGQWKIEGGGVVTNGANNAPLFLNLDLPDDVVVEVDIESKTPLVDAKIELMTDGRTHQSGYVFILGGWGNKISAIARLDEHGTDRAERSPTGVTGPRSYRWRIEKKGGDIRWLIDGQPYMTFTDREPLQGVSNNRLGFSNWQNTLRYDNLRIWPLASAPPPSVPAGAGAPPAAVPSPALGAAGSATTSTTAGRAP